MSSLANLEKYLNDPEEALSHLPELLECVAGEDSETLNYAVEALENCGPPRTDSVDWLCSLLAGSNSMQVYWASTLLGRWLQEVADSSADHEKVDRVEKALAGALSNSAADLAALERVVLALGRIPNLHAETKERLASMSTNANARLKRLIDGALGATNASDE